MATERRIDWDLIIVSLFILIGFLGFSGLMTWLAYLPDDPDPTVTSCIKAGGVPVKAYNAIAGEDYYKCVWPGGTQ